MKFNDISDVWNLSGLPANIEIGRDCYLELNKENFARFRSMRAPGLKLGDHVRVYDCTAFSVEPEGRIEVGDYSILSGTILMCAKSIHIGQRVIISYNTTIADCDFHPRDPELRKQDAIAIAPQGDRRLRPLLVARPVVIEDDVRIGIGAIVLKGVHIGRGACIGAGAVVTTNVPAYATITGNPARMVEERTAEEDNVRL